MSRNCSTSNQRLTKGNHNTKIKYFLATYDEDFPDYGLDCEEQPKIKKHIPKKIPPNDDAPNDDDEYIESEGGLYKLLDRLDREDAKDSLDSLINAWKS